MTIVIVIAIAIVVAMVIAIAIAIAIAIIITSLDHGHRKFVTDLRNNLHYEIPLHNTRNFPDYFMISARLLDYLIKIK